MGNEKLFNEEVRRVIKQAPEKVTGSLLRPNNSTAIRLTTQAVGSDAMQPVRRVALDRILEPDPTTKQIAWRSVVRRLAKFGDDTLDALFPRGEAKGIRRIADSVLESERTLTVEAKVEAGALAEARATAKAARKTDPFEPFRKMTPERLTRELFQPDNVTAVEAIKNLVGPEGFQPVQRVAMERVLNPDPTTGAINWAQVVRRLDRLDPQTLQAFFPKGHAAEVQRIARLMLQTARPAVGGAGKVGIMLTQWGVVAAALTGKLPPAAGTVLLGPAAISRIFANPIGLKWLSTGLEAPPWSGAALKATSQLVAFLWHSAQEDQSETKAPEAPQTPAAKPEARAGQSGNPLLALRHAAKIGADPASRENVKLGEVPLGPEDIRTLLAAPRALSKLKLVKEILAQAENLGAPTAASALHTIHPSFSEGRWAELLKRFGGAGSE